MDYLLMVGYGLQIGMCRTYCYDSRGVSSQETAKQMPEFDGPPFAFYGTGTPAQQSFMPSAAIPAPDEP